METNFHRKWGHPSHPGREDINGELWWACDPYPTWFRWDDDVLKTPSHTPIFKDQIVKQSILVDAAQKLENSETSVLKKRMIRKLYLAANDLERCVHSDGLGCGYREPEHPLGPYGGHDFKAPSMPAFEKELAKAILSDELVFNA